MDRPDTGKDRGLSECYFQHVLENGMVVLGERMSGVESAAMTLLTPAGPDTDPVDRCGSATVLSDLVLRGAGGRDSHALTDHLDRLGLQRSSSLGAHHTRFAAAAIASKVMRGIEVYADILRRAHLPPDGFESSRDLAIQALESMEDDPRQKLMVKLREWHLPSPYGRSSMGQRDHLEKLTIELCRDDYARRYRAAGTILAVAGRIDFDELCERAESCFGDWPEGEELAIELMPPPGNRHHEVQQSEQTHIGIAYPSIPELDEDYYAMRLAMEALGGGMSGRLFTELREKRGLVYNVWAGYTSLKGLGSIMGYAGTSNERAQQTLDMFIAELHRLSDGLAEDELDRAKVGLKAGTIMSGESTSARSGAIAYDYFLRGRIRTLEEMKHRIDEVTLDRVNAWLAEHRPGPFTIVTVGPEALEARA